MLVSNEELKNISGVDYYDGSIIHQRFAYKFYRDKVNAYGNIVSFISKTEVIENMIDLEDTISKDYIYSDKMINFCYELPLPNLWGGVAFQRLFSSIVGNILAKYIDSPVEIEGDDIFVNKEFIAKGIVMSRGKASVSIVTERQGAIVGHLGLNISCGEKAPSFAFSTNLSNEKAIEFIAECEKAFYNTVWSIFIATSKVI
jgi:hypothetical protein